jgi:hypothetical protein
MNGVALSFLDALLPHPFHAIWCFSLLLIVSEIYFDHYFCTMLIPKSSSVTMYGVIFMQPWNTSVYYTPSDWK